MDSLFESRNARVMFGEALANGPRNLFQFGRYGQSALQFTPRSNDDITLRLSTLPADQVANGRHGGQRHGDRDSQIPPVHKTYQSRKIVDALVF
jgi:hypothetical protein